MLVERARTLVAIVSAAAVVGVSLIGCGVTPRRASSPAAISHVVLVTLKPGERGSDVVAAMWSEAESALATIPGVSSFAAGPHVETGRASVTGGYDLGLYIGFDTRADYAAYVVHPRHIEFVNAWRSKIESLVVYDFADGLDASP